MRATWVDPPRDDRGATGVAPQPPDRVILVRRRGPPPTLIVADALPAGLAGTMATAPQPAFAAAIRGADGRWRTVAPSRALLSGSRLRALTALIACLSLFARRLTRPLRRLAEGDLAAGGPREVRAAAATIAAMRDRLAREAQERTRMLAAMAHDLRTPLTGLRLRAETAPTHPVCEWLPTSPGWRR